MKSLTKKKKNQNNKFCAKLIKKVQEPMDNLENVQLYRY